MANALIPTIQARFAQQLIHTHSYLGQETVVIQREGLLEIARYLKDDPATAFDFLKDLTCVDYLRFGRTPRSAPTLKTPSPLPYYMSSKAAGEPWARGVANEEYRFEVVCHFFSSAHLRRLRVKVPLKAADPEVDTLSNLWKGANWFEREVWDMFGIRFKGHPDLRRILLYEEFQGHLLRNDYPANKRQPLIGPTY